MGSFFDAPQRSACPGLGSVVRDVPFQGTFIVVDTKPAVPTDAFVELGGIKFNETTFSCLLTRITNLATRTIPGADQVSITLAGAGGAHTEAFTGEIALDEAQYKQGQGPCLEAAAYDTTVHVTDTATREPLAALGARSHHRRHAQFPVDRPADVPGRHRRAQPLRHPARGLQRRRGAPGAGLRRLCRRRDGQRPSVRNSAGPWPNTCRPRCTAAR